MCIDKQYFSRGENNYLRLDNIYYKTKNGYLINGETLEEMSKIEDGSMDMILCDLPYGQTARNKWDSVIPFELLWEQYERIIKANGAIILFANGMFTADLMSSNRKLWKYNLVWNKELPSGFLNAKKMPLRSHEDLCVFYKKPPIYNPQMTLGKPSHSVGKAKGKSQDDISRNTNYRSLNKVETVGDLKYPKSILNFPKPHPSISVHPTQKPVELYEWLIRTYTNEGETVLDNTSGSGTLAEAAEKNNRKWICIEQEVDYCEITVNRLKDLIHNAS